MDYLYYKSITNISGTQSGVSDVSTTKKEVNVPVDFNKLKKVNEDIYAWIRIPYADKDGEYIKNTKKITENLKKIPENPCKI